jgi:hypothetical protein
MMTTTFICLQALAHALNDEAIKDRGKERQQVGTGRSPQDSRDDASRRPQKNLRADNEPPKKYDSRSLAPRSVKIVEGEKQVDTVPEKPAGRALLALAAKPASPLRPKGAKKPSPSTQDTVKFADTAEKAKVEQDKNKAPKAERRQDSANHDEKFETINGKGESAWAKRVAQEDERQAQLSKDSGVVSVPSSVSADSRESPREAAVRASAETDRGAWNSQETESMDALRAQRDRLREREAARMQREKVVLNGNKPAESTEKPKEAAEGKSRRNTEDQGMDTPASRVGMRQPEGKSEGLRHSEHRHGHDHGALAASHRHVDLAACRRNMAGRATRQTCSKSCANSPGLWIASIHYCLGVSVQHQIQGTHTQLTLDIAQACSYTSGRNYATRVRSFEVCCATQQAFYIRI